MQNHPATKLVQDLGLTGRGQPSFFGNTPAPQYEKRRSQATAAVLVPFTASLNYLG